MLGQLGFENNGYFSTGMENVRNWGIGRKFVIQRILGSRFLFSSYFVTRGFTVLDSSLKVKTWVLITFQFYIYFHIFFLKNAFKTGNFWEKWDYIFTFQFNLIGWF